METSTENQLIINGEMFFFVRRLMRQKKASAEIIQKINELLDDGANINACDKNDNNNTILHIAVQKEEVDVVKHLLQKGARLICNKDNKTPLQLAFRMNTSVGKDITEILSKQCQPTGECERESPIKQNKEPEENNSVICKGNEQEYAYPKRSGTSGVSGQFYETKLLSLVLHRALHDKDISQFYLAANIQDIGDFDDVCFRFKNIACFMQTKHRENTDKAKLTVASVRSSTGKLGLGIYYDSFLKIRQKFSPNSTDPMFQGKFEDIETYFVLYTPLKESFERKLSGNKPMCKKIYDIIYTGDNQISKVKKTTDIFQFDFEDRDIDFLTKFIKYEQMKNLAKTFLDFIMSINNKLETMMASDLIKIYHPALAHKVLLISKVQEPITALQTKNNSKSQNTANVINNTTTPTYIHVGKFRNEFFYSEDYNLITLKDTFYKEIVNTHSGKTTLSKEEIKQKIELITNNPCAETISHLIGSPIKYDETFDKLSLDSNKLPKNMFKSDEIQKIKFTLQKVQITKTIIRDAIYLSGEKKLRSLTFQLPQSFGNIDLTTNQKTVEGVHGRLDFLTGKFEKLIERNENNAAKIIDINNDVVGPSKILELTHLNANGGIGGAVGNLLQFDPKSEYFTFNTKQVLNINAKYVLDKLKATRVDLADYKINVMIDGFPRVSFDVYQYDKKLAADFLSKLWFFTNQAQEESVETTIKKEINIHYNADKQRHQFLYNVHSDAIFLRFHDKIQKWWKKQTEAHYLTKATAIFEKAKKDIVDSPLLTVLNVMFIRKIKTLGVEFNTNAIDHLKLETLKTKDKNIMLNIISDAVTLSAIKIMQFNKYQNNYTFINLDYVHVLPQNDYETMMEELGAMENVTLVIISETPLAAALQDTLLNILETFTTHIKTSKQQVIIITGKKLEIDQELIFKKYDYNTIIDNKINLLDLTSPSQILFLKNRDITYQGQNVKLNTVVDENSKDLIKSKLLWSFLNNDKIEVGQILDTRKYNEIKNCYINRTLKRDGEDYVVNTLDDIESKVVLISSKPCMGKTILLTHLALETKKVDPKIWIVRVNMSSNDKDIENFRQMNMNKVMTYICKTALNKPDVLTNINFTEIDKETIAINSERPEDVSFELQLFVHFYNSGNIIFLFDGFDKIFPQNTNEGINLFATLELANKRMWITSDCYGVKVLENEFGSPYTLHQLSTIQQKSFLDRFWTTNLKLEKLNHEQFNNLIKFCNYILRIFNHELEVGEDVDDRPLMPLLSVPLHIVYLSVLNYFKNDAHSLSFCYFRETIKKKWRLNSYTAVDRYLRKVDEGESQGLAGTPLNMYIAANYFMFQITDKFDLRPNTKMFRDKSNVFINAVTLYERFLTKNIKQICEIENKNTAGDNQEKLREDFFNTHKNLALYAIFKESDISKILTQSEIREVKRTIKKIESGEMETNLIDSVVDGIPRFYHLLFAEYFIVETLSNLLKHLKTGNFDCLTLESFWDFVVNTVLVGSPPSLRNAFEYKLKYDPELAEIASNDNCKRIIFNLLSKTNQTRGASGSSSQNALDVAINEGLVNVTNVLLQSIRQNANQEKLGRLTTIIHSSANILEAADTSQTILSTDVLRCIRNINGETIMAVLNSNDIGNDVQNIIKDKVAEPIRQFSEIVVQASGNNENLVTLVEELPHHLPDFIRSIFNK